MDDNRRLGIALAAPVVLLAGGAVASLQTPGTATAAAQEEPLDPEVEKILYPYRVAKREKELAEAERILYPYRHKPEKKAQPTQQVKVESDILVTESVSIAEVGSPPSSASVVGDASDLEALLSVNDSTTTSIDSVLSSSEAELASDPTPASSPQTSDATSASTVSAASDLGPALAPPSNNISIDDSTQLIATMDPVPAAPPASSIATSTAGADISEVKLASNESPVSNIPIDSTTTPNMAASDATATSAKPPFLGVGIRDVTGTIVTTLYENSTAAKLGIIVGDEVTSFNGMPVKDMDSLRSAIKEVTVGEAMVLTIKRNGTQFELGPIPIGTRTE